MDKRKVLFICVHNSARSQMAEVFLKGFDQRLLYRLANPAKSRD